MTDFLKSIGEKYPDLLRYLKGLKRPAKPEWRDYENAKGYLRTFPLSCDEYDECRRYIEKRLGI
jgi:hypothetical protein